MEKKKPATGKKSVSSLSMRLDKQTTVALDRFIESQRVPPDKTAVVLMALHEFLQSEGFWPPRQIKK